MGFKDLSIVKKLAVGFGAVLIILSVSSVFVLTETLNLSEVERLNTISDNALDLVDRIMGDAAQARSTAYRLIIGSDASQKPNYLAARASYNRDLAELKAIFAKDAPQFVSKLAEVDTAFQIYFDRYLESQISLAVDAGTHQQAVDSVVSSDSVQARKTYEAKVNVFRVDVGKWSDDFTDQADRLMSSMIWVVALSGAISVIVGTMMAFFIARSVGGPVAAMGEAMRALAGGDHDIEIPARDRKDEIGGMASAVQTFKEAAIQKARLEADAEVNRRGTQAERERIEAARALAAQQQAQVVGSIADGLTKLAAGDLLQRIDQPFASDYESLRGDFNATVVQLQSTIKEVLTTTGQIRNGTGEIVSASDDLSRRTEQQAANLEETAAALAEISSAMKRTAEGASHARQVVGTAQQTAEHSNEVISRTITAMDSIDDASRKISQIIGVIDEIAFQTNLLALNAGVEAARAGEAGRGFAVVASEVRALAQRCAEAAKEVKTLVRSSEEHVKVGVDLVGESGAMLAQIVKQVAELKGIVENIANSAETQAMGLSEVNVAVTQLDQVTQQNAAMAEEATAAAHQLAQEGTELVRLVGRFNVGAAHAGEARVVEARSVPAARVVKVAPAPRPQLKKVVGGAAMESSATDRDGWQEF